MHEAVSELGLMLNLSKHRSKSIQQEGWDPLKTATFLKNIYISLRYHSPL